MPHAMAKRSVSAFVAAMGSAPWYYGRMKGSQGKIAGWQLHLVNISADTWPYCRAKTYKRGGSMKKMWIVAGLAALALVAGCHKGNSGQNSTQMRALNA